MMPTGKSKFNVTLFSIIAIAAIILAGGLIGVQQQASMNASLKSEYQAKSAEKKEIETKLGMMPQRQRELKTLNQKLASLDDELVDYQYIPTYLEQLQNTAKKTGNTLLSISPMEPRPFTPATSQLMKGKEGRPSPKTRDGKSTTGYWTQKITLKTQGSYVSTLQLLEALRNFRKLVYVRTVSLVPGNTAEAGSFVVATIETYAIITPNQYLTPPNASSKAAALTSTSASEEPEEEESDETE